MLMMIDDEDSDEGVHADNGTYIPVPFSRRSARDTTSNFRLDDIATLATRL